jgi:hypothetical protein
MSQDAHGRQDNRPKDDEEFDTKPNTKSKTTQKVRDAHFLEDGVKADGTGGKDPAAQPDTDEA